MLITLHGVDYQNANYRYYFHKIKFTITENYGLWTIETHASGGYLPLWANIDSNHAKDQGNVCYGYGDITIEKAHLTIQIKCNNEQQRCTTNSLLETLPSV